MTEPQKISIPKPPIGLPVQFFHAANPAGPCFSAQVLEVSTYGLLTLVYRKPHSSYHQIARGVWWMRDPTLKDKPLQARASQGGWDFIPGLEIDMSKREKRESKPPAKAKPPQLGKEQIEALIEERYRGGETVAEIADSLGDEWTRPIVLQVVRDRGIQQRPVES